MTYRPAASLQRALAFALPAGFCAMAMARAWPFVDDVPLDGRTADDWYFYKTLALSIVHDGLSIPAIGAYTLVPHGFFYNYFVAGVFALFGVNTSFVYVVQAAMVGAAASCLWLAARRGSGRAGGVALLLAAGGTIYADFITRLSFRLLSENLFLFLAAAALALLVAAERRSSYPYAAAAGTMLGLAVLSRTSTLASIIGVVLAAAVASMRRRARPGLAACFMAGFVLAMCVLPLREYVAVGRPDFDLITDTKDWVRPPDGLWAKGDYYGRRLLFILGATPLVNPAYRPRPHWALIWVGVTGYLASRLWWRRWPSLLETCVLLMLPLYLGPVWLFSGIDNYGGRMVAVAMPFAAVLAARFTDDVLERSVPAGGSSSD